MGTTQWYRSSHPILCNKIIPNIWNYFFYLMHNRLHSFGRAFHQIFGTCLQGFARFRPQEYERDLAWMLGNEVWLSVGFQAHPNSAGRGLRSGPNQTETMYLKSCFVHTSIFRETGKGCEQTAATKFTRHIVALASPSLNLTVDQK